MRYPALSSVSLVLLAAMLFLWWRFGVLDYRGEYVWITYSVPPTEAEMKALRPENPTTASLPIIWRTTTESVPESRIADAGCYTLYQDCDQVFYRQGGSAGRFELNYTQVVPWYGKHNPRQFGERSGTLRPLWNLLVKVWRT